jgi:hypothetical protein
MTEAVPVFAAIATLRATRLQLWMARLFGKKFVATDSGCVVTMHKWRGKFYLTDCREEPT